MCCALRPAAFCPGAIACALPGRGGCCADLPVPGWVGRSRVLPAYGWPCMQASPWAGSPELPPGSAGAPGSSLPHTSAAARRAGLRSPPGRDERRPQHRPSLQSGPAAACHGRRGGCRHPANVSQQRRWEGLCSAAGTAAGRAGTGVVLQGRDPTPGSPCSLFPSLLGTGVRGCDLGRVGNATGRGVQAAQGRALPDARCVAAAPWGGRAARGHAAPRCTPLHPTASRCSWHPPVSFRCRSAPICRGWTWGWGRCPWGWSCGLAAATKPPPVPTPQGWPGCGVGVAWLARSCRCIPAPLPGGLLARAGPGCWGLPE